MSRTTIPSSFSFIAIAVGLSSGLASAEPSIGAGLATVIFVPGAGGTPEQFATLQASLSSKANARTFAYDAKANLDVSAKRLAVAIVHCPGPVLVIAHSMGASLPMYLGVTDRRGQFRHLKAIYINPLIGGSRYADRIRALWWLQPLKGFIQQRFFPASVRDLAPESDFQQEVFGIRSSPSSFRQSTILLFTERPGYEPDIEPSRVPKFFGQSRNGLLARIGAVPLVRGLVRGHAIPLQSPDLILPLVDMLLRQEHGPPPLVSRGRAQIGIQY